MSDSRIEEILGVLWIIAGGTMYAHISESVGIIFMLKGAIDNMISICSAFKECK